MVPEENNSADQLERSLIDIAVESWRFSRLFGRVVNKLDAGEAGRYVNQLRYFHKRVNGWGVWGCLRGLKLQISGMSVQFIPNAPPTAVLI